MANLGTSSRVKSDQGSGFPFIYPGVSQKVAFDASSKSTAFGSMTSIIRLWATQDCHLKIADDPTAVTDGTCVFLKSATELYLGVQPGQKIAAIKDSAGGNLFITEGA